MVNVKFSDQFDFFIDNHFNTDELELPIFKIFEGLVSRVEQDVLDFLDLVHFGVLVSILTRRILFLSPFQDVYFQNLDLVLFLVISLKILIFSARYLSSYVFFEFREFCQTKGKYRGFSRSCKHLIKHKAEICRVGQKRQFY